jgi:DNA-binding transcriptional LysR family regulator
VDAHLLRTFVTVARRGSFSAAAAELQYTQAAVSQQIAALEGDLKVTLLRRRPVEPTEAGARLLEHAVPILLRMDAALADVTRMTAAPAAQLTVAMTPLAAALSAATATLAELRTRLPRLDVTIRIASREDVAESTARGKADLGLTDGIAAPNDPLQLLAPLSATGLAEVGVSVILPCDHPLATAPSRIGLSHLADARWIDAPAVAPTLTALRRATGIEGFRAACWYDGTDTLTLFRLAAEGHGLTLLPAQLAVNEPSVTAVQVREPRLVHRVELVHGVLPADSPAAAFAALISP